MKQKGKGRGKMIGWIVAFVIVAGLGIYGKVMWSKLMKEHEEAKNLPLDRVDFTKLEDGIYEGTYEGGMYKWRANRVKVTVRSGAVSQIELLTSKEDKGDGTPQQLYDRVIKEQSLQVDTVSGATLTSKAFLQGIENALLQAE